MNRPANCTAQEPAQFKPETLTTLKLIKKFNPAFVTTFIVSQKEAHCLTGADLRRCENMISLKKKKEINAKYSGLLKSKVRAASYDIKNKKKCGARVEKPKTPRHVSARSQSKKKDAVKGNELKTGLVEKLPIDCKAKKSGMKEIFKSNVYSNMSSATVDDSAKCSSGHLPTPKQMIESTGSKITTYWNLLKSNKAENLARRIRNKKIEPVTLDNNLPPKSNVECEGFTLKSKTVKSFARKTQINPLKISKRSCYSLINTSSSNECKVLYKNCLFCNRRKCLAFSNKINSFEPWCDIVPKTEKIEETRLTTEEQSSLIGFASSLFTMDKVERATVERVLEERFTCHESYIESGLGIAIATFIKSLMVSEEKESVEDRGETKFASNTPYKIASVTFGIMLSLFIVHLLYTKFLRAFVIK